MFLSDSSDLQKPLVAHCGPVVLILEILIAQIQRHGYANPFRSKRHIETQICYDVGCWPWNPARRGLLARGQKDARKESCCLTKPSRKCSQNAGHVLVDGGSVLIKTWCGLTDKSHKISADVWLRHVILEGQNSSKSNHGQGNQMSWNHKKALESWLPVFLKPRRLEPKTGHSPFLAQHHQF